MTAQRGFDAFQDEFLKMHLNQLPLNRRFVSGQKNDGDIDLTLRLIDEAERAKLPLAQYVAENPLAVERAGEVVRSQQRRQRAKFWALPERFDAASKALPPAVAVENRDFVDHVLKKANLTDIERLVLRRRYFEGKDFATISKETGTPVKKVHRYHHSLLSKLRDIVYKFKKQME